jgi:hypothetical protein
MALPSSTEYASDVRTRVFRKVGTVVIVVGLIDVGIMLVAIANRQFYSLGLNIFAVIAGVLLLCGNAGTAKKVLSYTAFFLGALLTFPVAAVMSFPLDFLPVYCVVDWSGLLELLIQIALGLWMFRELTSVVEFEPRQIRPIWSLAGGLLLFTVLIVAAVLAPTYFKAQTVTAISRDRATLGESYKYFVSGFSYTTGRCPTITITAYRRWEIRTALYCV